MKNFHKGNLGTIGFVFDVVVSGLVVWEGQHTGRKTHGLQASHATQYRGNFQSSQNRKPGLVPIYGLLVLPKFSVRAFCSGRGAFCFGSL